MKLPSDMKSQERGHRKRELWVKIDKTIRLSGLLASLSPENFQTLVAIYTFADQSGNCHINSEILAQTLNMTHGDARSRLQALCGLRWKGRPLVEQGDRQVKRKVPVASYRITKVEGLGIEKNSEIGSVKVSKSI